MGAPLKEIPSYVREHTHAVLTRLANNRNLHLNEIVRLFLEERVALEIHNAKVVLGMDDDKQNQQDLPGFELEEPRVNRKGRR